MEIIAIGNGIPYRKADQIIAGTCELVNGISLGTCGAVTKIPEPGMYCSGRYVSEINFPGNRINEVAVGRIQVAGQGSHFQHFAFFRKLAGILIPDRQTYRVNSGFSIDVGGVFSIVKLTITECPVIIRDGP